MNDTAPFVLVIEDHEEIAALAAYFLWRANYHPVIAPNGMEGLRLARAISPALILCDVGLPDLNGLSVLAVVRSDPLTAQIPFVMMSGYPSARCGHPMPDAFLEKPLRMEKLLAVIAMLIPQRSEISSFANAKAA
jgi:DNA-binding response OmpR family regulator